MTTVERFDAIMNFRPFDHLPIVEWAGWWNRTIDRWHGEGLDPGMTDRYEICHHLGLDVYKQRWLRGRGPECPSAPSHGAAIIGTLEEYERILPTLYPDYHADDELPQWASEQAAGDTVIWLTLEGYFWFPRTLLGIEPHFYAFYDKPALMHRINSDVAEWSVRMIERFCRYATPNFVTFAEDLSYNHGPMLSRELFDEYLLPYYRMVVPELRKRGIIVIVDSDGDVTVPAHWFEEAGIQGILPLERQAGVDINRLRSEHPHMRFIGHFDKMVMNKGEERMRQEFERLLPAAAKGGFIPSCDHQTPPGVSLDEYKLYLRLFAEYGAIAGKRSQSLKSPSTSV